MEEENKVKCEYSTLVDIHKLTPNPKNPNKHPKEQIERLAKIIDYQGMRSPIVVSNRSGFITKGHGRLEALKSLNWKKAPVDYQDYEDEAQEYADMVADNAIAEWAAQDLSEINTEMLELGPDFDVDLLGIKDFTIEPIEKYDEETQDDVPEVTHDPKTKRGDVWLLGEHRVMCGDSTMIDDVEKLMKGKKADMVFTDPPYGIGFKYNSHKDAIGDEYEDFCRDWFHNLKALSEFIVISTGWAHNKFWYSYDPTDCFYWLSKNKRTGGKISHFRKVEPIFIWGKPDKKYDFDFWEQTSEILEELKGKHTCPKPVSLIESILKGGKERGLVVDFFTGSGTTLIACEKTKRKCYGMELDEHYCDVIVERWQKYTGKKATLESTGKFYDDC